MKLILNIEGMHCNGCRTTLENELNNCPSVISTKVSLEDESATIYVKDKTKYKELEKIVEECGFKCTSIKEV